MAKYYIKMDELKAEGEEIQEYAKNIVDAKVLELINLADKLMIKTNEKRKIIMVFVFIFSLFMIYNKLSSLQYNFDSQ